MTKILQPRSKVCYVYALLDPRKPGPFYYGHWKFSHEPFYIGKGKGNRVHDHMGQYGKSLKSMRTNIIIKLEKLNLKPIISIKKNKLTHKQSLLLEIKLISLIGRKDLGFGPLANHTDGGDGASGRKYTKEHSANQSKAQVKRWENMTEEQRETHRNNLITARNKPEYKRKASLAAYNRWNTMSNTDRQKLSKKSSEASKKWWASLSAQEYSNLMETYQNRPLANYAWWTDGKVNIRSQESPGKKFHPGRTVLWKARRGKHGLV